MATYAYKGRNSQGQIVEGTLEANNQNAVADLLMQKSIIPINILETKVSSGGSGLNTQIDLSKWFAPPVKMEDLIIFSRQMYSLAKSGIPLLRAINGLADTSTSPKFKEVLHDITSQLEKGRTLSSAMNTHPKIFNKLMVSIVHVGENTGKLDLSFLQLATYFEQEEETKRQIKSAMRYPTFVVSALVIALVIMNIFVIPTFKNMFTKLGADLPPLTKFLLAMSEFFMNYWQFMLVALVGGIFGIKSYLRTEKGQLMADKNKLKIPHIGSIIERAILSRFCRSFSLMMQSGVPITTALGLVSDAVDNVYMGTKIVEMRRGIEKGESISRVAAHSQMFTPLVMQMVSVGEETGRIDELLLEVADYYDREVSYDLGNMTAKIEPILISIVSGMVLVLALGIFSPMWDMMGAMR